MEMVKNPNNKRPTTAGSTYYTQKANFNDEFRQVSQPQSQQWTNVQNTMLNQYQAPFTAPRAPYQWPQVSINSKRLIDFSNTTAAGTGSVFIPQNQPIQSQMQNNYRSNSSISGNNQRQPQHIQQFSTLNYNPEPLLSPGRLISLDYLQHSSPTSLLQQQYTNSIDQRTGRNTSSQSRVRQEHTSPLRSSSQNHFNESQRQFNLRNDNSDSWNTIEKYNQYYQQEHSNNMYNPQRIVKLQQSSSPLKEEEGSRMNEEDMEAKIMKMHSKMKNLESRYLDLANFYKRELLTQQQSNTMNNLRLHKPYIQPTYMSGEGIIIPDQQINEFSNRSPLRQEQFNQQQTPNYFDETHEKALIGDLLREKTELEKDLSDLMSAQMLIRQQPLSNNSEVNIEGRFRSQHMNQLREKTIDSFNRQMSDVLSHFQENFIEFINQNYQSFTENDVIEQFQELRERITDLLNRFDELPSIFNGQKSLSSNEVQEALRQAVVEYELSSGYTTQSIKKAAFELQSKHDTAQLDSKKAHIALQIITKKCSQLSEVLQLSGHGSSSQNAFNSDNHTSGSRQGSLNRVSSHNNTQQTNQKLIQDIQGQVQVLHHSLQSITDRLASSEVDLRYLLNDVEAEQIGGIERFKQNLDQVIEELRQINKQAPQSSQDPSPVVPKNLNESYNDPQAQIQSQLNQARLEIQSLKQQTGVSLQQFTNSKGSFGVSPNASSGLLNNEAQLQMRLNQLMEENHHLTRQVHSLNLALEERSSQNSPAIQERRERSRERVNLEQILFYQKKYDDALRSTKELAKLTQRFLNTMRKLQKAVHRKEANVSTEKQEFEDARKDLELRLKDVKREVEHMSSNVNDGQQMSNNLSEGNHDSSGAKGVTMQIHRYQNKAPNTLTARNSSSQNNSITRQQKPQNNTSTISTKQRNMSEEVIKESPIKRQTQEERKSPYSNSKPQKPIKAQQEDQIVKKQILDLTKERDSLKKRVSQLEEAQIDMANQCTLLQSQLLNKEHLEKRIDELILEKESLTQERGRDDQQMREIEEQAEKLYEQVQTLEGINHEQKQRIEQMEDDADHAQQAIEKLRSLAEAKEKEVKQIRKILNDQQRAIQQDREIHQQNKIELTEQINDATNTMEQRFRDLENEIQAKEQQISKIRKLMQQLNQRAEQQTVLNQLNARNKQLESSLKKLQEEMLSSESRTQEVAETYEQELARLKEEHDGEVTQIRDQVDSLTQESRSLLQRTQSDHQKQLSQAKQDFLLQLQQEKSAFQQRLDQAIQKHQSDLSSLNASLSASQEDNLSLKQLVQWLESQIQIYLGSIEKLNSKAEGITMDKQGEVKRMEEEVRRLRSEGERDRERLREEFEQKKIEIEEQAQKEVQKLRKEVAQKDINMEKKVEDERKVNQKEKDYIRTQLQSQIDNLQQTNQLLEQDIQSLRKDLKSQLQSQESLLIADFKAKLEQKQTEFVQLQEQYQTELNELTNAHEGDLQSLQEQISSLEQVKQSLEQQVQDQSSDIDELMKQNQQLSQQNQLFMQQNQNFTAQNSEQTSQNQQLTMQNQQFTQQNQDLTLQNQHLTRKNQDLVQQIQQVTEEIDEYKLLNQELNQQNQDLIEQNQGHEHQKQHVSSKNQEVTQLNQQLSNQNQELLLKNEELSQQNHNLTQQSQDLIEQNQQLRIQCQQTQLKLNQEMADNLRHQQDMKGKDQELEEARELISEMETQIQTLQEGNEQSQNQILAMQEEAKNREEQNEIQIQKIKEENIELIESMYGEIKAHQLRARQLENDHQKNVQTLQEQLTQAQLAASQDIDSQTTLFQQTVSQKDIQIHDLQSQVSTLNSQLSDLNTSLNELSEENEHLHSQITQLTDQLASLSGERDLIAQTLKNLQIEHDQANLSIKTNLTNSDDLKEQLQQLLERANQADSNAEELDRMLSLKNEELQRLKQDMLHLQAQVEKERQESEQNKLKELEQMKGQIKTFETRIKTLEDEANKREVAFAQKEQQYIKQREELEKNLRGKTDSDAALMEKVSEMESMIEEMQNEKTKILTQRDHSSSEQIKELEAEIATQKSSFAQQLIDIKASYKQQLLDKEAKYNQELLDKEVSYKKLQNEKETNYNQQLLQKDATQNQKILEKDQQIDGIQEEHKALITELENRVRQAEEAFEQQEQELQQFEAQNVEHQRTLSHNRDLIQMLKTELEKAIQKQKLLDQENTELKNAYESLATQMEEQSRAFEERIQSQTPMLAVVQEEHSSYTRNMEEELRQKTELIEEANKYIEEFNDEKHQIKAKFKHLIQVLDDPSIAPEEESEYKEEDEIDLDECLERLEREVLKSKKRSQEKLTSLQDENARFKQNLAQAELELQESRQNMTEAEQRLKDIVLLQEQNEIEVRRQLDNASKKLTKYKTLANNLKAQIAQPAATVNQDENLVQENLMLLQRLQRAENELQNYRLSNLNNKSQDGSHLGEVDLEQIEKQLVQLRKQLFEAKDKVIDTLTETFVKKFKDLQSTYRNESVMKGKLSELKTQQALELTLNNNVKAIKEVKFYTQGSEKRLVVVQVLGNNECYVIDEGKLSETGRAYLRSFMPSPFDEADQLELDQKDIRQMEILSEQVKEIREERQELNHELMIFKSKLGGQEQFADLKTVDLEEEVMHLTSENLEIRVKIKELSQQNRQLQLRLLEINQLNPLKVKEENEQLRMQLSSHTPSKKNNDDIDDESFLEGIKVAENINHTPQLHLGEGEVANALFDQSSLLLNMVEGFEEGKNQDKSQEKLENEYLKKENEDLKNKLLQVSNNTSQQQQSVLQSGDQGMLKHVKGTLGQFLRNCPTTERNNEDLLKIIFSIMEYTQQEITEIQDYRQNRKGSAGSSSNQRAHSLSNSAVGGTDPGEDEIRKKTSKGIFGMFSRKQGSQKGSQKDPNEQDPQNNSVGQSPAKYPIAPIRRH